MPVILSGGQQTALNAGPDTYADIVPPFASGVYYAGSGIGLSNEWAAYGAIYKAQLWVYTVVRKVAVSQARLPMTSDNAAYVDLLSKPNPLMDGYAFWLWTRSTQEVYGEAIWLKGRDSRGRVRQLYPIHPTNVTVRRDSSGTRVYDYNGGRTTAAIVSWPATDIVHFRSYNPDGPERGLSPLEPLRQTLLGEDASRRAQQAFWSNGARPSVVLTKEGVLTTEAAARIRDSWDAMHRGVDSFGKTAILEEGLTPHVLQLNAEEMQYVESRRLNREEVCGVYDVPPPVVHILDRATFSNITEQMRSMYRDTMAPRVSADESCLRVQLGYEFGNADMSFSMDEVMRGSPEQRMTANQAAIYSGQKTPNEARAENGDGPLPGGDRLYINSAAIPLEVAEVAPPTGTNIIEGPQRVKELTIPDEWMESKDV